MDDKNVRKTMTRRQRLHHSFLHDLMQRLEYDLHSSMWKDEVIPAEWEAIATRPNTPHKKQLTMRVDQDVIKFFKATGRGYLTRMNDVLRAYMEARLSGMILSGERFEHYINHEDYAHRPIVGDWERTKAELEDSRLEFELKRQVRERRDARRADMAKRDPNAALKRMAAEAREDDEAAREERARIRKQRDG